MCSGEQKQEVTTDETTETVVADTSKTVCAGGCGMEMDKAQMVSHEVDGETNYYCSEKCKEHHLSTKEDEKKKENRKDAGNSKRRCTLDLGCSS